MWAKYLSVSELSYWVLLKNGMVNRLWSYCSWEIGYRNAKKCWVSKKFQNLSFSRVNIFLIVAQNNLEHFLKEVIEILQMQYNVNSCKKNYYIANKFWLKWRQHFYCFYYKMVLKTFTSNNGAILPLVDYVPEIYPVITYIGEEPWANLTLTSSTVPSFDFLLKNL